MNSRSFQEKRIRTPARQFQTGGNTMTETQNEIRVARNHKDRLFRMIFREKKELLSLYNAVNGTSYTNAEDLEIVTLENPDTEIFSILQWFGRTGRKEIFKVIRCISKIDGRPGFGISGNHAKYQSWEKQKIIRAVPDFKGICDLCEESTYLCKEHEECRRSSRPCSDRMHQ